MPTGKEIVQELVKLVHVYYELSIEDFYDEVNSDLKSTDQAISDLKAEATVPPVIKELLDCFQLANVGNQYMSDNFLTPDRIEIIDFNGVHFTKRNRPFCISDSQFGYLATKKIFSFVSVLGVSADPEGYKTLIDFIGASISLPNLDLLSELFKILEQRDEKKGLLVHKFAHTSPSLSIYSYLYFQELIQGGQIDLDPLLNYRGTHGFTFVFNPTMTYQQYFEVFDIINELNHSQEIITRFLKVYHMLEYLVYRVELVKVEVKARTNRTFIREIHGLAGKGSSEWEIFRKNFIEIFTADITARYFDLGALTADQSDFFKNYLGINTYTPTDSAHVCQLIYRLRNSIVHNKESEFHMTTTNPDGYASIVPLLSTLIQKLERIIYQKISVNYSTISYRSPSIELY